MFELNSCRSFFFFSSRRRHTRCGRDWSSDVCSPISEPALTGGFSEVDRAKRVAMAQAEFRAELSDWAPAELDAYVARHYPPYWLKVDLPHKLTHARFVRSAEHGGRKVATGVGFDAARGVTELTVLAP